MSALTSSGTSTTSTISTKTFQGLGNLVKLLPSGTVFVFEFLNPVMTNNGQCHASNKYLTSILIALCGISCIISSFTESYTNDEGTTQVGIVSSKGVKSSSSSSTSSSTNKLQVTDFVHALLSVAVFAVIALLDPNTVDCFYPSFKKAEKNTRMILPIAVGVAHTVISILLPSKRNGVGYSTAITTSKTSSKNTTTKMIFYSI